eukprot:TRINITY_DN74361_c0_g1_i1.p1 TRINITY_DN74361_c0_g1~~TRINITY_DN74361_c0_g1_i1.p1  ORF type:complete len:517 (-),score=95.32 TRINITY_DN74361_c0_g1_i1:117-1667(-)
MMLVLLRRNSAAFGKATRRPVLRRAFGSASCDAALPAAAAARDEVAGSEGDASFSNWPTASAAPAPVGPAEASDGAARGSGRLRGGRLPIRPKEGSIGSGIGSSSKRPVARLKEGLPRQMKLEMGHPWVYDDEVANISELTGQAAGTVVDIVTSDSAPLGAGVLNRQASIVVRRMEGLQAGVEVTQEMLRARLRAAFAARKGSGEFCRLVHGELDGLPGIFVDRFGMSAVVIFESVGSTRLEFIVREELSRLVGGLEQLAVHRMVAKKEKWAQDGAEFVTELSKGQSSRVVVTEQLCALEIDVHQGVAGHWSFALEAVRERLAQRLMSGGGTVLDIWAHAGQWGVRCSKLGASEVVLLEDSLAMAKLCGDNLARNDVELQCTALHRSSILDELRNMAISGIRFNCVALSFRARFQRYFKQRRGQFGRWFKPSLKGYETAVYLAAQVVGRGGYLVVTFLLPLSDEHLAVSLVQNGLERASRVGALVHHETCLGEHAALASSSMDDAWNAVVVCVRLN